MEKNIKKINEKMNEKIELIKKDINDEVEKIKDNNKENESNNIKKEKIKEEYTYKYFNNENCIKNIDINETIEKMNKNLYYKILNKKLIIYQINEDYEEDKEKKINMITKKKRENKLIEIDINKIKENDQKNLISINDINDNTIKIKLNDEIINKYCNICGEKNHNGNECNKWIYNYYINLLREKNESIMNKLIKCKICNKIHEINNCKTLKKIIIILNINNLTKNEKEKKIKIKNNKENTIKIIEELKKISENRNNKEKINKYNIKNIWFNIKRSEITFKKGKKIIRKNRFFKNIKDLISNKIIKEKITKYYIYERKIINEKIKIIEQINKRETLSNIKNPIKKNNRLMLMINQIIDDINEIKIINKIIKNNKNKINNNYKVKIYHNLFSIKWNKIMLRNNEKIFNNIENKEYENYNYNEIIKKENNKKKIIDKELEILNDYIENEEINLNSEKRIKYQIKYLLKKKKMIMNQENLEKRKKKIYKNKNIEKKKEKKKKKKKRK